MSQTTQTGAGADPGATPAIPGVNTDAVNRAIPGSPATIVNARTARTPAPHQVSPEPLYRDGLTTPGTPSVQSVNRANGTVGQQGVTGVTGVTGVRAVGSGPINQDQ